MSERLYILSTIKGVKTDKTTQKIPQVGHKIDTNTISYVWHQIVQIKNLYYKRNHYFIECGGNAANAKKQGAVFQKKNITGVRKITTAQKMSDIRGTYAHF